MSHWNFAFTPKAEKLLRIFGVKPENSFVELDGECLVVHYGRFQLRTPRSNIAEAKITGPYKSFKVIGPHLSAKDDGLTFGTSADKGVCISFKENVKSPLPFGRKSHSALTVTISNCESFVEVANRTSDLSHTTA